MKWYRAVFKKIFKGIVLFLLPVMLLLFIFKKAIAIVQGLILPIKAHLPTERIFGVGVLSLISLLLILLICYVAGMVAESKKVKSFIGFLEDNLFVFIPGYAMMKSRASEAIGNTDDEWKAVLIGDGDDWKFGIEVDRQPDGVCTIFFPEPPDAKSGEMKLIHESKLKRLDMPVSKLVKIIRQYGHGAAGLVKE
jgi:uncharacterized membrane protein